MESDVHNVMGSVVEARGDPCYLAEKYKKKSPTCVPRERGSFVFFFLSFFMMWISQDEGRVGNPPFATGKCPA